MYPNPQEALPLWPQPSVEQYAALANDLVSACASGDPAAIHVWALRWIDDLATAVGAPHTLGGRSDVEAHAARVDDFARKRLAGEGTASSGCTLADAQFVIARVHGFSDWSTFLQQLEALAVADSAASAFEDAATAIVSGDRATLERLLRAHPELPRLRSMREHRGTLLHYVSANGVEGYRQRSPKNAAELTTILLEAGVEVDAEADVYGGACTALGLVATSAPPFEAGVQRDVMEVLLAHGARLDRPGTAGAGDSLVRACLANGQPDAAEYLVSRGAPLDLVGAAGMGRVDLLRGFFQDEDTPNGTETLPQTLDGFSLACSYGRRVVVEFFLDRGIAVDTELRYFGEGHTGLHVAAFHAHLEVVDLLLRRGAAVDPIDRHWGTTPLVWALTGWSMRRAADPSRYHAVATRLVAAGAAVAPDLLDWDNVRQDPAMLAALSRTV